MASEQHASQSPPDDRALYAAVAGISAVALLLIGYVLYLRDGSGSKELAFMPSVNAALNTLSASCQIAGYLAIRNKKVLLHRSFMVAAFVSSALFFIGYLAYHFVHGDTRYPGEGALRIVYLLVLASHVLLSIALVPMVLITLFYAAKDRVAAHRRLARFTLPVWLYVSVTGVVVFLMLRAAVG